MFVSVCTYSRAKVPPTIGGAYTTGWKHSCLDHRKWCEIDLSKDGELRDFCLVVNFKAPHSIES